MTSSRKGGDLLVVQTNNATFGCTAEAVQQLAMTRLRAIEHGRATVQVSTVGVSAIIRAGRLGASTSTKLFTRDVLVARVPLRTPETVADRVGQLAGGSAEPARRWPCCAACAAGVVG